MVGRPPGISRRARGADEAGPVKRRSVSVGVLVASVLALAALGSSAARAEPSGTAPLTGSHVVHLASNQVSIVRDNAGIPHITALTFRSLGYGKAWAFAQDNFCTLAQDFVTVNGERSRYFGPNALAVNYSAGTESANIESDFFWQSVKQSGLYKTETAAAPPIGPLPQVKSLYAGFVSGYNAYLRLGHLHDPRCVNKPWVRPITGQDMFLRGVQIATEASSAQFVSFEGATVPPSSAAVTTAELASPVLSRVDLTALAKLRESGSSTSGSNGIGFNQHLAWTHTVSTSFRFTFYKLKLVPGHPTSYWLNGKRVPMGTETVRVNLGHGSATHTYYTTHWGRVLDVPPAGYTWTTKTAYAVDDVNLTNEYRAANQYFEMARTKSVKGLLAVEAKYLAIPTFNTVAADDQGNALYGDIGNTPNVSSALIKTCLPAGLPTTVFDVAGVVTLDGSTTKCAWATDPGTPVPGIFNASHEPHAIRTDYVENSNDSYWLANPHHPFRAYSPIIGKIGVEQGLRTRLGNLMIAERLAGTDGLGAAKFTIPTLQAMWEGDRSLEAELVLRSLVAACRNTPEVKATNSKLVDLRGACGVLAHYDRTDKLAASGGWLFSEWNRFVNSGSFWADKFNTSRPLTSPSKLDTANPDILRALADAVQGLRAHHIALDATYGQVQHVTRNGAIIAIHGCDTGCFNAIYANDAPPSPLAPAGYGGVYDGSSLVMTTELTKSGPISQGILTYSQATNPRSKWYSNMTSLYSKQRWVHLPYTPAQLAAQPGNRTTILTIG